MKVKNKRIGDIFLNPLAGDLWFLNKIWCDDEQKEIWTLNLIHDDLQECLEYVKDFIRIGNIYDMVAKELDERYGYVQEEKR